MLMGDKGVLTGLICRDCWAGSAASVGAASVVSASAAALPVALGPHRSSRLGDSPTGCESRLPPRPRHAEEATRLDSCSPRLTHGLIEILGTETESRGRGDASPLRGDVECSRGEPETLRSLVPVSPAAVPSGEQGVLMLVELADGAA